MTNFFFSRRIKFPILNIKETEMFLAAKREKSFSDSVNELILFCNQVLIKKAKIACSFILAKKNKLKIEQTYYQITFNFDNIFISQ